MYTKKELMDHTINIKNYDEMKEMKLKSLFLPYVGSAFGECEKPTYLLVMESHYLPGCFNGKVKDASKFYSLGNSFYEDLKDITGVVCEEKLKKAIEHCYSAKIFSKVIKKYKNGEDKSHSFYKIINNLIMLSGVDIEIIDKKFAIMNYFQRPAEISGDSVNKKDDDMSVAYENLVKIIDILEPNYIIFASIKAGNAFYHGKKNSCLDDKKSKIDEVDDYFKDNNIFIVKHLADTRVAKGEYSKVYKEWYKKLYQDKITEDIIDSRDLFTYIFKKKE